LIDRAASEKESAIVGIDGSVSQDELEFPVLFLLA
jgi:hypothetical protein